MQELVEIKNVIGEEIHRADFIMKNHRELLEPVYLAAAEKLKKYKLIEKETDICSVLKKAFGQDHEKNLERWLPESWKRPYEKSEKSIEPSNLEEEYLKRIGDLMQSIATSFQNLYSKTKSLPKESDSYKGIIEIIKKQFRQVSDLQKAIEDLKDLEAEWIQIQNEQDERQKLNNFQKIYLKVKLKLFNKDHLAKTCGMSSKWLKKFTQDVVEAKNKLEEAKRLYGEQSSEYRAAKKDLVMAEEIQDEIDNIDKCFNCGVDLGKWLEKNQIRRSKNRKIENPPTIIK